MNKFILPSLACSLFIAACGGGGGGSTPPPPPTPPPSSNTPPVASASASNTAPREGETINLDGSASSDADGDTLSYSWVQTSGPTVDIASPNAATTDITINEVTSDTTVVIQLQVSDGTDSRTTDVTLSVENIQLSPETDLGLTYEREYSYQGDLVSLAAAEAVTFATETRAIFADGSVERIYLGPDQNQTLTGDDIVLTIATPERAKWIDGNGVMSENLGPTTTLLADFTTDNVLIYPGGRTGPDDYSLAATNPCSITDTQSDIVIGQENGEILIYRGPDRNNLQIVQRLQITGPACDIAAAGSAGDNTFIAYDSADQSFKQFVASNDPSGTLTWTQVDSSAIDLNLPTGENVDFVRSLSVEPEPNSRTEFGLGFGLGLLFTNGETEGVHRFVFASSERDINGVYSTPVTRVEWDFGTPFDMAVQNIDFNGDNEAELLITTPDSPYAIVLRAETTGSIGLRPIQYVEIGFGAEEISDHIESFVAKGFMISYPEDNQIRLKSAPQP